MLRAPWVAASRQHPCPACGRGASTDEWCQFIPGKVAICRSAPSNLTVKNGKKKGWFIHKLNGAAALPSASAVRSTEKKIEVPRRNDLHILAKKFSSRLSPVKRDRLARHLGLSAEALIAFEWGWTDGEMMFRPNLKPACDRPVWAYSCPKRNAEGNVTGIYLRAVQPGRDDFKFSFTGGGEGLFIPRGIEPGGRIFMTEGATDTPAAWDMGLKVVGRPNDAAGVDLIVACLRQLQVEELVIFSQRDEAKEKVKGRPEYGYRWPAQEGAEKLADCICPHIPTVRVIMPPEGVGKDVRKWLHAGGSALRAHVLADEAPVHRLRITKQQKPSMEGVRL